MSKEYFTIKDLNYKGRDVLVLVNFDVPLKDGEISDDEKIRSHLETLSYLDKAGAKRIFMISHLGRPKGKHAPNLSTRKVAKRLSEILDTEVGFVESVGDQVPNLKYVLLENIRFNREEESKEDSERDELAKRIIAMLNDPLFINDGFATNHREYASVTSISRYVPSAAGILLEKEITLLKPFIEPEGTSLAILGGKKIEDKLDIIASLAEKYDNLIVGGAMVFTFLKALGNDVGQSIVNQGKIPDIQKLLEQTYIKEKLIFPEKVVLSNNKVVPSTNIPYDGKGLDVLFGPRAFEAISNADFIFWNGPMGVFEDPVFREGSEQLGRLLQEAKAKKLAGGGDTLSCIKTLNLNIPTSTGGGAASNYIINGTLPGIEALKKNYLKFKDKI